MNTIPVRDRARKRGWALLIVMALSATALLLLASVMTWANENAAVTARATEYFTTTYAAEAATEKALGSLVQDDQNYGQGYVYTRSATSAYSSMIPTASDNSYWSSYQFGAGTTNGNILVQCLNTNITNYAGPPYSGLQYVGSDYEIVANAKNTNTLYGIKATVGQEVILGQIWIFQFAIFYNDAMEIAPGANMVINGLVHGNTNIYIDPNSGASVTFSNDLSATGTINFTWDPLNPQYNSPVGAYYFGSNTYTGGTIPLELPVGTNLAGNTTNIASSVYSIIQVPPAGESPTSSIGTNRLYNQVDMIITISNNNVITVTSGVAVDGAATTISNNQWASWINTNGSFFNMRDGWQVAPVDINVGGLRKWSSTNTVLRPLLAAAPSRTSATADVQSIFVVDQRSLSNAVVITNGTGTGRTYTTNYVQSAEPGLVLTNGAQLPSNGLSVVTPDPLYVVGNWNVTNNNGQGKVQTYDVSDTLPSALYCDALNIFSPGWTPDISSNTFTMKVATPDTVNAAIMTGIVPSNGSYYSGGVENYPRFQENWSGVNFYYNGSMVEMFTSHIANYPWPGTGTIYNPPNRDWAFDTNFSNPSDLPPLTPRVIYINRARWTSLTPGTTVF